MILNPAFMASLRIVLDYVQPDEEEDYAEQVASQASPEDLDSHIVHHIRLLRSSLEGQ